MFLARPFRHPKWLRVQRWKSSSGDFPVHLMAAFSGLTRTTWREDWVRTSLSSIRGYSYSQAIFVSDNYLVFTMRTFLLRQIQFKSPWLQVPFSSILADGFLRATPFSPSWRHSSEFLARKLLRDSVPMVERSSSHSAFASRQTRAFKKNKTKAKTQREKRTPSKWRCGKEGGKPIIAQRCFLA